ncbi:hypothetical protein PLESTM_000246200 [Pleodorina starrii]|nr:hypothetical protein PLESTM_000246200 [Pleodorina starrii]
MPPNGFPVITGASAANLPATYSAEHMSLAWELLQGSDPDVPLDPKLLELCPPSIALLTVLVEDWMDAGCPGDVAAFVHEFMRTKLIDESLKEWRVGLEDMAPSQRITVLNMSFPSVGAHIDTELHPGLERFLEPHLDRTVDGRYYLHDSHQRQIVRLLFNSDGTPRERCRSDLEYGATLTQLDLAWNLFHLGEVADYLLGPHASRRWERKKPPAGMDEFKAKVQAIADEIANKLSSDQVGAALGPQELWERQSWFQRVLLSRWNNRDCATYKDNKRARSTHLAMLVFYLRLSRNVLAHTKPWDRKHGVAVDVDVIEALPRVLGRSHLAFNELAVGALRMLPRHTMEEAAAELDAQLSSGGASIESLAKDEGSSSGGLSSGTGGSRWGGQRGGRSGEGRGRGVRAMADNCAPACPGPAAGCGQRTPLVYATGRHTGVWGQEGPRAATLAPRLRVQRSLFAPSAAVGLRLPCRSPLTAMRHASLMCLLAAGSSLGFWLRV